MHEGLSRGMLTAAVILLASTTAEPSHAGDRAHMDGFFMRLSAGGGGAATEIDLDGIDRQLSGPSGDINFAFGAIVSPNLAVHATLFGWSVTDPDFEYGSLYRKADGDLSLGAIGAGITYYIMPANVYLSGSIGIGVLSFDGSGEKGDSDGGPAVDMTIGKEWWVGSNWGLGVAGTVGFHSVPHGDIDANWRGANIGVRFTATLN